MKGRAIILDGRPDGAWAAALMVDGRLEDLLRAPPAGGLATGDIVAARITRVLPKAGAFCETPAGDGYLRDARGLTGGERVTAQVLSLPEPGKAVTLTTRLLFRGPRLILTPGAPGVNVSRRIGNETERARLTGIVAEGLAAAAATGEGLSETMGAIIRTEARGEDPDRILAELQALAAGVRTALAGSAHNGPPLADWLLPLPDAIVASPAWAGALAGPEAPALIFGDPRLAERLCPSDRPLDEAGAAEQMEAARSREVALGAGRMTLEATRALVAVDIDTGSDFSPAAGLKANLDAARALPRALRLRGLGGQIVVDFAPMPKQHRRTLDEAIRKAFRDDPVETALIGWTAMGLCELQRKRERRPWSGDLPR